MHVSGDLLNLPRTRKILYVGDPRPGCTSAHRLASLKRLQQDVICVDVPSYHSNWKPLAVAMDRIPIYPLVRRINRDLLRRAAQFKPDVVWFDKPIHFTRATISALKFNGADTVCYNLDNPFGPRNDGIWYQFKRVFRFFDLHCVPRSVDVERYRAWGLPHVKILLSYEPSAHYPPPAHWPDSKRDRQISYIGAPYEDRAPFLLALAESQALPVSIDGYGWHWVFNKAQLKQYVRYGYLVGDPYREHIWRSRINLSFLTRLNEEDIAHKSVEIAACQGFLLALRCEGHQAIFEEDKEAVFFSSVEECADKCRFYLNRPDLREAIAHRGRERAVRSGYDNDTQMARILNRLDGADV